MNRMSDKKLYAIAFYFLSAVLLFSCNPSTSSLPHSFQSANYTNADEPMGEKLLPSPEKLEFYKRPVSNDTQIVFIWLMTGVLFAGLARFLFPLRFNATMQSVFNARNFSMLEKETGLMDHWIYFFLYVNYLNAIAVLFHKSFFDSGIANTNPSQHILLIFSFIWTGMALYTIIRYWLMKLVAWIFNTSEETRIYFRNTIITNQFTGILVMPVIVVYIVNPLDAVLWTAWGIFLLISVYKVFRGAAMGLYHSRFSLYYLILYLCAFEIIPLVFLVKLAKLYFQI